MSEWKEGERKEHGLMPSACKKMNAVDAKLFSELKLTYQSNKGDKRLIPLLIPSDVVKAMEHLADPEVREQAQVLLDNHFMFPATHKSKYHVNRWHSVNRICKAADVEDPNMLTATKQRHRISTLYAGLDVDPGNPETFYQHMGHTAEINQNVYQAPLAEKEMQHVVSHLL